MVLQGIFTVYKPSTLNLLQAYETCASKENQKIISGPDG
jgi:hypothetical protein